MSEIPELVNALTEDQAKSYLIGMIALNSLMPEIVGSTARHIKSCKSCRSAFHSDVLPHLDAMIDWVKSNGEEQMARGSKADPNLRDRELEQMRNRWNAIMDDIELAFTKK